MTHHTEQSNDDRVTPSALVASPLKRKEQADNHSESNDGTNPVDDSHALKEGLSGVLSVDRGACLEEEKDSADGETNDGNELGDDERRLGRLTLRMGR